jgi:hypothetical protein
VAVEEQEQVLEHLQLLGPHYRVVLVDKVLDLIQTGQVAEEVVVDTMVAAEAAEEMTMDLEPVPLLVVEEDLDI